MSDRIKKATLQVNGIFVIEASTSKGRKLEGTTNRLISVVLPEDVALDVISDIKGTDIDPESYRAKDNQFHMDLFLDKKAYAAIRGKDMPALVDLEFYLTRATSERFTKRNGEDDSAKRLTGTARNAAYVKFNLPDVVETERDNRGRQSSRVNAGVDAGMAAAIAQTVAALAE